MRTHFEKDEEIEAAEERLKLAFPDPERGSIVPWSSVEEVMGRGRFDKGGWHIVRQFRNWIARAHQIVTFCETEVGIRLLTDREASREVPAYRQRKAMRQVHRGLRELNCVRVERLTDAEQLILGKQIVNMEQERKALRRSRRSLMDAFKRPETPPKRPPPPPKIVKPEAPPRRVMVPKI